MDGLTMRGPDGGVMLGWLAAVGILRVLTPADTSLKLSWARNGAWRPVLHSKLRFDEGRLLDALVECLDTNPERWRAGLGKVNNLTKVSVPCYANALRKADGHDAAGLLAAYASDCRPDNKSVWGARGANSPFVTLIGSSRQHWFPTLAKLTTDVRREHLQRALFETWDYADEKLSLRWDPVERRNWALRATDPASEPARTMWGGNRLAIEALPLFPVMPGASRSATTGWIRDGQDDVFRWPIWSDPLALDVIRTLVGLDDPGRRPGVVTMFASRRLQIGKQVNFAPAREVAAAMRAPG